MACIVMTDDGIAFDGGNNSGGNKKCGIVDSSGTRTNNKNNKNSITIDASSSSKSAARSARQLAQSTLCFLLAPLPARRAPQVLKLGAASSGSKRAARHAGILSKRK